MAASTDINLLPIQQTNVDNEIDDMDFVKSGITSFWMNHYHLDTYYLAVDPTFVAADPRKLLPYSTDFRPQGNCALIVMVIQYPTYTSEVINACVN